MQTSNRKEIGDEKRAPPMDTACAKFFERLCARAREANPDHISMSYGNTDFEKARREFNLARQLVRSGHIECLARLRKGLDGAEFIVSFTEKGKLDIL